MREPCPRCIAAAHDGTIKREMIMPLREVRATNSMADDGSHQYHCKDCDVAQSMARMGEQRWPAYRMVVGLRRSELLRATDGALPKTFSLLDMMDEQARELDIHYDWLDEAVPGEWG